MQSTGLALLSPEAGTRGFSPGFTDMTLSRGILGREGTNFSDNSYTQWTQPRCLLLAPGEVRLPSWRPVPRASVVCWVRTKKASLITHGLIRLLRDTGECSERGEGRVRGTHSYILASSCIQYLHQSKWGHQWVTSSLRVRLYFTLLAHLAFTGDFLHFIN